MNEITGWHQVLKARQLKDEEHNKRHSQKKGRRKKQRHVRNSHLQRREKLAAVEYAVILNDKNA